MVALLPRNRSGRPTLIEMFLVIIIFFSWMTFYMGLKQGNISINESSLPLLHSLQGKMDFVNGGVTEGAPKDNSQETRREHVPHEKENVSAKAEASPHGDKTSEQKDKKLTKGKEEKEDDRAEKSRDDSGNEKTQKEQEEEAKLKEAKREEAKEDPVASKKGVHKLAGLDCSPYGGPSNDIAQEMVYWEDIPSDSEYQSKFRKPGQYMTFESDHGGWNNVSKKVACYYMTLVFLLPGSLNQKILCVQLRMAMETCLAIAAATGRTLVLPPEAGIYLLHKVSKIPIRFVAPHKRNQPNTSPSTGRRAQRRTAKELIFIFQFLSHGIYCQ
jgi:hypothetical protein